MPSRVELLVLGALALGAEAFWDTCPRGPVGSCLTSACSPSRGPTECDIGQCNCLPGYCRYPNFRIHVRARRCRAQVPHSSCHLTRFCYKGGLMSSSCVSGRCLCRSHMHVGSDGQCYPGWYPTCDKNTGGTCKWFGCSSSRGATDCISGRCICKGNTCAMGGKCIQTAALGLSANMTTPMEDFAEDPEEDREEEWEIMLNVATAAAFVALPISVAIGGAFAVRRIRQRRAGGGEMGKKLLDGADDEIEKVDG